jgi:hypothetical protein
MEDAFRNRPLSILVSLLSIVILLGKSADLVKDGWGHQLLSLASVGATVLLGSLLTSFLLKSEAEKAKQLLATMFQRVATGRQRTIANAPAP